MECLPKEGWGRYLGRRGQGKRGCDTGGIINMNIETVKAYDRTSLGRSDSD